MSTINQQAALWGPGARDWADYNEPMCTPFYTAVLDAADVGSETRLLDAGCGGGFALHLGARRGATVSGFDVTPEMIDIARERVPQGSLAVGDIENPPPFEGQFDVVTSFNAVQFASDPKAVVANLAKVLAPAGRLAILVWGPPDQCETGILFKELGALMPPSGPPSPNAIDWSDESALREMAAGVGLEQVVVADVSNPLIYPDLATAVRTQLSSGPARLAIRHSGLAATRGAVTRAFAGSRQPDGTYRQDNVFRYLIAKA